LSESVDHPGGSEQRVLPAIERFDSLSDARPAWQALAGGGAGIFGTFEWTETWWRHHGLGRELLLHGCRDETGRLTAVLPLYAWRARRPRVLRFLGHGPGDELGPVCARADLERAARDLHDTLARLDWDVVLAEQLPAELPWVERLGGRAWRREASPTLVVRKGGWDEYLSGRSPNFRQQLRRRERALHASGRVRFRLADEESLTADLDVLFALHRSRWGGRATDFSDTPFHRELAAAALRRGWLRLWLLELDGRPVAAWHGFRVGDVMSYYQAGRDPALDRLSVGFVLLAHTVRAAIDEGAAEYRFGRGAEGFKYRFTGNDAGLDTVTLSRDVTGRAAIAAGAGVRGAYRMLKRFHQRS
jgi:CelD/BcsL family acetyltransferase involved in cellulose biosynthesis